MIDDAEADDDLEEAQILAGSRFGVPPEISSAAGRPSRQVLREGIRRGFDLFGGFGADNLRRRGKQIDRAAKDIHEIETVANKLLKLFHL